MYRGGAEIFLLTDCFVIVMGRCDIEGANVRGSAAQRRNGARTRKRGNKGKITRQRTEALRATSIRKPAKLYLKKFTIRK